MVDIYLSDYSGGGGGDVSSESDRYSDLLNTSLFKSCTFDGFYNQNLISLTNMLHSKSKNKFTFIATQYLISTNLFDALSGIVNANEYMVLMDYDDTGVPVLEVSADGGVTWDIATLNEVKRFTVPGNDIRLKFTAGGTGEIRSWAILYNPDIDAFFDLEKGLRRWFTIATNYYAFHGDRILANSILAPFSIYLPATPVVGDEISVRDGANFFATNNVTMDRNGNLIDGIAANVVMNANGEGRTLIYSDDPLIGWISKTI